MVEEMESNVVFNCADFVTIMEEIIHISYVYVTDEFGGKDLAIGELKNLHSVKYQCGMVDNYKF